MTADRRWRTGRWAQRSLTAVAILFVLQNASAASELVMYTSAQCAACLQFEREIGDRYDLSDVAATLPLRRRVFDPDEAIPAPGAPPVRGTPTFVALCDGREIDRITGYTGDELFWMRIAAVVLRMPERCSSGQRRG